MSSSFKFTTTAALALCGAVSASVISRDVTTGVELFAYGPGIGGLPIIYADGAALIGYNAPDSASVVSNVTFSTDYSADMTALYAFSNDSLWSTADAPALYLVNTTGAYDPVGFSPVGNATNSSMPTGAQTSGFGWYGHTLAWVNSDGDYETLFYASNSTTSGTYNLLWNQPNQFSSDAVPVTIKSTAPSKRLKE